MGPENARNDVIMNVMSVAAAVRSVDALTFSGVPTTELQADAIVAVLDFDGLAAAGEALKALNPPQGDGTDTAKN